MFHFVIPTFNERNNVEPLVMRILDLFPESKVLVVDDSSPDGTGTWCDEFAKLERRFSVLHRMERNGIGAATIEGLIKGMDGPFDWLVTLDGDGSHDPADFRAISDDIGSDKATVWIGSRYCPGGQIESWPWHRRLTSKIVNSAAKLFLRIPVSDYSGAYRVYHRSALQSIDLNCVKSQGYAYLEEVLAKLHRKHVQIREFPICFNDRIDGKSKADSRQAFRAIRDLVRIFFLRR